MRAGLLVAGVATATGLALWFEAGRWISPDRIRSMLEGMGPWGPVAYVAMMALAVVVSPIPSLPLDVAAGAIYGPLWGTALSVVGAEFGALIGFGLARVLGRQAVARLLGRDLAFCDRCARRQLIGVIFAARLIPAFSFDLVSYAAGLTGIGWRAFAGATLLGMIPPTLAITYFGSSLFAGGPVAWALAAALGVGFFAVPIWIRRKNPWGLYDRLAPESSPRGRTDR